MQRILLQHPQMFASLMEMVVRAGLLQFSDLVEQLESEGAQVPPMLDRVLWNALAPKGWVFGTYHSLHSSKARPEITKAGEIYLAVRYMLAHMRALKNDQDSVRGVYAVPPGDGMDIRCWPQGDGRIYLDLSSASAKSAVELVAQFWASKDLAAALNILFPGEKFSSLHLPLLGTKFRDTFSIVYG